MIPSAFVYLESLPLTSSGKVDRRALPDPEFKASVNYVAPRDELEESICLIWQTLLGIERVGIYDNFFRIGGNSILAIRAAHQLSRALKQHIGVADIFLHNTVAALANRVIHHGKVIHIKKQLTDHAALSFAQERLWFIEQFEEGTHAYNIPLLLELTPGVNIAAFKQSLVSIVNRHEVLRTVFKPEEATGLDMQVVLMEPLAIKEVQVEDIAFRKALQAEINHVFRLTEEYPFRAMIYHCGSKIYVLVVVHHIAFDGWSINIFLNELSVYYHHYAGGQALTLPPLDIQYKDFAVWQRDYLSGETLRKELEYWQKKLLDYQPLSLRQIKPDLRN